MHGIPPAASNSTQKQAAKISKLYTLAEKFQGQGRPTRTAGSGQVPTGVQTLPTLPLPRCPKPQLPSTVARSLRAAVPPRLGPLHLVAREPGPHSGTCLPAPGDPHPGRRGGPARPWGSHPARLPSRTPAGSARGPSSGREGAPGAPRPGRSCPTPRPRGASSPLGARMTRRRASAPWCRRHRRLPLSPAYRRPEKQRRAGAKAAARSGHQHWRRGLRPSPGPRRPKRRPHPAQPLTPFAPPRPAGPAHSTGAEGVWDSLPEATPPPLATCGADWRILAFRDRSLSLCSAKPAVMRPLIGQKALRA